MENSIILGSGILLLIMYFWDLKNNKPDLRTMIKIGIFSGISYILYITQFIKYPQGGGISLFSMVPVMLLSILYGRTVGLTAGLIFGLSKMLNGMFVVHPAQFLLDYVLSTMGLGLACVFGRENKFKIFMGCLFAVVVSVGMNILSGAVYFGQYAPEGMNVWWYSFIYNGSSAGVEGILCTVIVAVFPIKRIINRFDGTKNTIEMIDKFDEEKNIIELKQEG
ncbi:MAG: energy-coupled thiamine transporter ThiT [Tepidibacter sp.]|jgi:thiamine transporter|uniref:energy-coupled thiamine transporter ThiT n=1 Tax=Tepidibacter sp. TaxID=2529387 RepID=UPI0025EBDA38|nr:energy-coupled thiamine transporter ThiT [Tepidibacter sp.]MCT4508725.1 energy-coupled thiamine transporter ThiT [Tepidibacter sp.]